MQFLETRVRGQVQGHSEYRGIGRGSSDLEEQSDQGLFVRSSLIWDFFVCILQQAIYFV